ncbi:bifunctional phosphoribosylaminoimidazolecarboxamide formyltransferase/IMP cyclohydrolase [Lutibaculum baratangense]|uniref:Bifunctional purine biosynthesis protein PurH n=1 Tax=Lutibaculum baratangense AMV1 TaxID=631454 RepID=V4RLE4_9HYPH|nr:bifunctional phosphoribosylaminoimidazolecarboxamide formyltransferase/IMP cyclohydrolase [Lutibaculum baratangense]ESR26134.1 IMP cyclohydrolase [Lutibaculum baratangense AMV1]
MTDQILPVRRALVSVSDKAGLEALVAALAEQGVEIVSTGGTAKAIAASGAKVIDVAEVTGFPEMLDGRVKTLNPRIHGGLLADRSKPEHMATLEEHGIQPIDLLVSNLYPFEKTIAAGADFATGIENIDIGGPAMTRAAAKNMDSVAVVVDPEDYGEVIDALRANGGGLPLSLRRRLGAKAFARTAAYDAAIAAWLARQTGEDAATTRVFVGTSSGSLRYGENPHQFAGFYKGGPGREGVGTARQLQGKALSYNNLLDTDAAFEAVAEFPAEESAAVVIVKHANPCGVALGDTLVEAYRGALRTDPVSAYGGIVATNRPLDAEAALAITEIFTEVIIAPGASEEAAEIVAAKPSLRLLVTGGLPDPAEPGLAVRSVAGGYLVQSRDNGRITAQDLQVVTKRAPTDEELRDLLFAWRVAKHVKSNAIVYARAGATAGIGAGQMSRVDSAHIAARKAADAAVSAGLDAALTKGSVVASDAFFPFADGLLTAIEAGATAVIQPGGSMRDDQVIAAADEHGIAMVFTGMRHFRH